MITLRASRTGGLRANPRCTNVAARKFARSVHEAARDKARAIAKTEAYAVSCRERKKVEMFFAHLKRTLRTRSIAPSWPDRSQRRVPIGRHRPKFEETGQALPFRSRSSPHEAERPAFAALTAPRDPHAGATTGGSPTLSTLCGNSRSGLRRGGEREKAAVALRWRNVAGQRPRWQYWPMEIRDAVLDEAPAGCMVLSRSIAELWQAGHKNDPAIVAQWLENRTIKISLAGSDKPITN